jgi:hypothetical protein
MIFSENRHPLFRIMLHLCKIRSAKQQISLAIGVSVAARS